MIWQDLLNELEVQNGKLHVCEPRVKMMKSLQQEKKTLPKRYYLDPPFEKAYLTEREAFCMARLLRNKTYAEIAQELHISPRTVEFYTNNMKAKLSCFSKSDLIRRIGQTNFLKTYEAPGK